MPSWTELAVDAVRAPSPTARMTAAHAEVVLRHGEAEHSDELGARDVWVFEHDGLLHMHYDAAGPEGWLAALATSEDGIRWTKRGPVLQLGHEGDQDSASASYGTTFFDGQRWHMFYLGTPNVTDDGLRTPSFPYMTMKAEAESPEGPWIKRPDVRPFLAEPGTWYEDTASPGAITRSPDGYRMFFSGAVTDADGRIWRSLGVARTDDLDATWSVDAEPLLPLTEQIENSSLHFEESSSTWFLFTNHIAESADGPAVQPQGSTEYTDAIWVYWASDLDSFTTTQKAVVVDSSNAMWSPRVIGLPSVIRVGDRLAVYYDGAERDSISHGYRDVGVAWLDLPLALPTTGAPLRSE